MTGARPIKVNLGCGEHPAPGWVNVDHGSPHPHDITADLTAPLPPELGNIGMVYAGHVLEHLPETDVVTLLGRLRGRMVEGGQLMAVGPDVVRARTMHERGELDDEWLRLVVEGGHRWDGDAHQWECEPERLAELVGKAGWRHVREVPVLSISTINWPIVAYETWQCAVTAYA